MRSTFGHRCKRHILLVLALVAWLGLVSMGMAHGMADVSSAHVAGAGPVQTASQAMHARHAAHGHTASGSCSMHFGCHCGSICYGVMLPCALLLAHAAPVTGYRVDLDASVPARIGEPPLHPPSI